MSTPQSAIEMHERISRRIRFTSEADARRYLSEVEREGFYPATPSAAGIIPYHHADGTATYEVLVEKQTHNGTVTPVYDVGDRVIARCPGMPGWQPLEGTVIHAYGHGLKVQFDTPNVNGTTTLECQDYEVSSAAS